MSKIIILVFWTIGRLTAVLVSILGEIEEIMWPN